jgi:uncharacterized RDD family membrane protein YckC
MRCRWSTYGGFWRRVLAYSIVAAILGVADRLLGLVIVDFEFTLFSFGLWWLYFIGFNASSWQGTPGKRILGLSITDLVGNRISFGRATGRFFAEILCALTMGIGWLMIAFTEKKQGLHDKVAGTLVVKD